MVLGKRWLFSIWNGAEIRPLELDRKSPDFKDKEIKIKKPYLTSLIM